MSGTPSTRSTSELEQARAKLRRLEKDPLTRHTMLAAATAARVRELESAEQNPEEQP